MRSKPTRTSMPVRCAAARDFYLRKDFDPKVGLTVVIIGALISAGFYWFGRRSDRLQHPGVRGLRRSDRVRPPGRRHRLLSLPLGVPRQVPAHGLSFRPPHRRRARAGIRAQDRPPVDRYPALFVVQLKLQPVIGGCLVQLCEVPCLTRRSQRQGRSGCRTREAGRRRPDR